MPSRPDWSLLEWTSTSTCRSASAWPSPTWRAAAPSPVPSAASGSSGATTACATRRRWSTRSRNLVNNHGVGFFILADEEPTINRKKFIQFCEELIARDLPDKVKWGINTRVTDIMRDKELLPLLPQGRPGAHLARHRGRGAAQARPVQQGNQGRREQGGDPPAARGRHLRRGAVHRRPRQRDAARRWRKPTRWRGTGSPISPTGRCTRPGPSLRCSRSWATRSRSSTSREVQLRHPDHEARSHGPGRAARPGDEQLPALLHAARRCSTIPGAAPASGAATCSAASRPSSRQASSASSTISASQLLGPAVQEGRQLQLRPHPMEDWRRGLCSRRSAPMLGPSREMPGSRLRRVTRQSSRSAQIRSPSPAAPGTGACSKRCFPGFLESPSMLIIRPCSMASHAIASWFAGTSDPAVPRARPDR
jgi:hypothetical protein